MQKTNLKIYLSLFFMQIFSGEVERVHLKGNEISGKMVLSLSEKAIENKILELSPQELHDRMAYLINSVLATNNLSWLPRVPFRAYEILDLIWKYCDTPDDVTHDILDILHAGCYNNDLTSMYYLSEMYRRKAFFSDVSGEEQKKLNSILAESGNPIALIKIKSQEKEILRNMGIPATHRYLEDYKYDLEERLKNIDNAISNIDNIALLEDPEYTYCLANYFFITNQKHLAYVFMQKSAEYGHPEAIKHLEIFEHEENIIHTNENASKSFLRLANFETENLLIKNHANKAILDNEDKIIAVSKSFSYEINLVKQNMLKSNIIGISDLIDYYIRTGYQTSKDEEEKIIDSVKQFYLVSGFENFGPNSDSSNKLCAIFLLTRNKHAIEIALQEKNYEKLENFIDEIGTYFIRNPQNKYLYDYLKFDDIIEVALNENLAKKDNNIALRIGQLKTYIDKRSEALEIFSKLDDNCDANFLEACMLMSDNTRIKK